ncbi:hypothetical protein V6N13_104668 [Hibiscus sabdariffa]
MSTGSSHIHNQKRCTFFQWLENGEGCENVVEDWKVAVASGSEEAERGTTTGGVVVVEVGCDVDLVNDLV